MLEVAVELNTLSSSASAAYLSEDALDWLGADKAGPAEDTAVLKPLPCSLPPRKKASRLNILEMVSLSALLTLRTK